MTCIPNLQSWCIIPSKKDSHKFTKAHQYLQRNPAAAKLVINHDHFFYKHLSCFRIRVKSYKNDIAVDPSIDVLSNSIDQENSLITASDLLGIIRKWNLIDVLDIQEENSSSQKLNSFIIVFKTAVSAHVMTKLKKFPDLLSKNITISTEEIDPIPNNARVPLVYLQGIGPETSDEAIRHFFRDMSFILKIKKYQRGTVFIHILKLPSIQNAINLSKQVNEGKLTNSVFNNSSQTYIIASHQYKSTITQCFFISSNEINSLKKEDVYSEVSKFGEIESLFSRNNNNLWEFYVKMKSLSDAKIACGSMNNRTFDNVTLKAVFISNEYFDDFYNELQLNQFGQVPENQS
ncbi:hypothetical protein M9Y10_008414 [Tritrichomonas musculus]|uniref:RRM domain-containing protein n=1 Tax=Tritrichomonas musculus TaxID=1915356 RepID=A0ABR2IY49_9EUKA